MINMSRLNLLNIFWILSGIILLQANLTQMAKIVKKPSKKAEVEPGQSPLCSYVPELSPNQITCSIFGRLHLKTGDGKFHRCWLPRVVPLLDTPFLTVQLTVATVTNSTLKYRQYVEKVVVLAKGVEDCLPESHHSYTAVATRPLSLTFDDGLSELGELSAPLVTVQPRGFTRSHVEIVLRHLKSVVIIRRFHSDNLSPSISITLNMSDSILGKNRQLCVSNCLGLSAPILTEKEMATAVPHITKAMKQCHGEGLVDGFLDACISDLTVVQLDSQPLEMAASAYKDILQLNRKESRQYNNDSWFQNWNTCNVVSLNTIVCSLMTFCTMLLSGVFF